MSVKIDGIEKLEANYFKDITILENNKDDISVYVNGGMSYTTCDKLSREFEGLDERGILLLIVERYLDTFKINSIRSVGKLAHSFLYRLNIGGGDSEKNLYLDLSKPKYKVIYNMAMNKYLQDRYDFCFSEDIKQVKISFSTIESKYGRCVNDCLDCTYNNNCYKNSDNCLSYVSLILKTNKDGKVEEYEKIFIRDYLYYMFSKFDDRVKIKHIYKNTPYIGSRFISEYILECGDIRIVIPSDNSMKFIFNIVDEYNKELMNIRKENEKMLKKQLKMEGF